MQNFGYQATNEENSDDEKKLSIKIEGVFILVFLTEWKIRGATWSIQIMSPEYCWI